MKSLGSWLASLCLCASVLAQAQTQTTGNVVYSTVNPAPEGAGFAWSGFQVTESTGGGLSGGHVPGYNIPTGQFLFGYAPGTIGYSIALNTVLSGTGIQLSGIQYGLQYFNQDFSRGTLSTTVTLQDKQGSTLESYYHALPQTTQGWTNFDQTKTFTNPYQLSNIGNATMSFSGQDDRFWAGYYGPQVRNPYMRFNYGADICGANPLSSPDCPGYAAAYFNQQCTISALFNPACPGYAAAYLTQQCTINPLADPLCPGYQQAYKTQQCSINPLYATDCPGYAAAYKSQQCSINPLYATDCPGYQQAYKTQQCSINPLYATDCPGYAQAYYTQQCTANALYDSGCPGYQAAYAKKNILNIGTTTTTTAATTAVVTESATSTAKTDPISIATTNTTTSTTSPTSVTSVTSVVSGGSTNATTAVVTSTQSTAQSSTTTTTTVAPTSTETRKTDTEIKSAASTSSSRDDMKGRVEARAKEIARAGAEAKSFEAQAAVQGTVVALMGFVPGFDVYGQTRIVDVNAQQMARLYNRPNVDNRNALRGLTGASDRVHKNMVDQQYQQGR